ncbi:hypothetical protein VNI00_004564 [Paramarasmius palmivorus]|uniref:Ricin B lectin domain-containing protein n=1 Tax=Paramarasmius palmivorus TaxID=297713 RepID=A0AAW0DJI3_9AGAR
MSATSATPATGCYLFINLEHSTVASLSNGTAGTAVRSADGGDNAGQDKRNRWNVARLANGKYTIQNYQQASFATTVGTNPTTGSNVVGSATPKQWLIKAGSDGAFTISTTSEAHPLFWGLISQDVDTEARFSIHPLDLTTADACG